MATASSLTRREAIALKWASVGLYVFITAFLWAPARDGLEAIYALAFFIPVLLVLPWRKPDFAAYGGWYTLLGLGYGFYAALTAFWAPESNIGFFIFQWVVLATWLCGVSWLAANNRFDLDKLIFYLLCTGALIGLVTLVVFYSRHPLGVRLEGWSAAKNPNVLGSIFGVLSLLAYVRWLQATDMRKMLFYAGLLSVLLLPLLFTQNRGGMLALLVTAIVALACIRPSRPKIILHLVLAIVLGLALALNYQTLLTLFDSRLDTGFREVIWQEVFWRSLCEHPLFGIGLEKDGRIIIPDVDVFNHAHNVWLDIFYRTGLLGLTLSLVHTGYVLRHFSRASKLLPLYLWLICGCFACLVDYRGFFWQIDARWFLYWIPVGLIAAVRTQEKMAAQERSNLAVHS